MKALFFLLSMTVISMLLVSCGQYGALYLPKKTPSTPVMKVKNDPHIQAANLIGQPR